MSVEFGNKSKLASGHVSRYRHADSGQEAGLVRLLLLNLLTVQLHGC